MQSLRYSRRDVLKASTAVAAGAVFANPLNAAMPEASSVTQALIEAAHKEGKVVWYSGAFELYQAEKVGKIFEAKYPGMTVRVERSGSERLYQRIGQERQSQIYAVDVVHSTDGSHFLDWKRKGWLAPYVPADVAQHFPSEQIDADGTYATVCAWLTAIGYNTNLVKRDDAPKSITDLLDPKWKGKIVKAHPSFSGMMVTSTYLIVRDLGWSYFEKLAQQRIMQVQSAADTTKKIALGERSVTADSPDFTLVLLKEEGRPIEVVYPAEGAPLNRILSGVFRNAPNPNAARLFQSFLFSAELQQILVDSYRPALLSCAREGETRTRSRCPTSSCW